MKRTVTISISEDVLAACQQQAALEQTNLSAYMERVAAEGVKQHMFAGYRAELASVGLTDGVLAQMQADNDAAHRASW